MGKEKRKSRKKSKTSKREVSSSDSSDDSSTDEEELKERKRQKAEKKARKLGKRLQSETIAGYSNESNPFGDTNLTERFVWHKKLEKQINDGMDIKELGLRAERKRQENRMKEIQSVKKRREERELEKAQAEEEALLLNRERAAAEAADLEKKEEEFHLQQAKERSIIRVKEGRAKPIDVLSKNLNAEPKEFDLHSDEPHHIFAGLTYKEIQALKLDIRMHLELDIDSNLHQTFWHSLMVVCDHEENEIRRRDEADRARMRGEEPPVHHFEAGLHKTVDDDVKKMFENKTVTELQDMDDEIQDVIDRGGGDVEYWDAVSKRLKVYKARAQLHEIHSKLRVDAQVAQSAAQEQAVANAMGWLQEQELGGPPRGNDDDDPMAGLAETEKEASQWRELSPRGAGEPEPEPEPEAGSLSPTLYDESDFRADQLMDPEEDFRELQAMRKQVAHEEGRMFQVAAIEASADAPVQGDQAYRQMVTRTGEGRPEWSHPVNRMLNNLVGERAENQDELEARAKIQAQKIMGEAEPGEGDYRGEVAIEQQAYWWHDKYRPRKPKYFNRVHTGYEWNKYNQTHYDHDNPPPKVVQGYKFNIFYPDLIDKNTAPTYRVIPDGSKHGETALLIFQAGPPYEDIAFKIVNKDWEYSHKRGFKCSFERGIMHLYIKYVFPFPSGHFLRDS
ncbi:hypothetical protein CYMTET_13223 [Cymbomonas tetramitiformis]|uniref:Splicing factor Cactin n=1 Tax=Cymbomonas tetramitiformis TaxID=36881 RepID=A0AAE0LBE6_9CHLO|nr:hypothetical protein CYMTET_13223 [Cymbomonas tetramitiformis]